MWHLADRAAADEQQRGLHARARVLERLLRQRHHGENLHPLHQPFPHALQAGVGQHAVRHNDCGAARAGLEEVVDTLQE